MWSRLNSIDKSSGVFQALCNLALKSSTKILSENNARRLLKSAQNPDILINSMSINMSDYFITLSVLKENHICNRY